VFADLLVVFIDDLNAISRWLMLGEPKGDCGCVRAIKEARRCLQQNLTCARASVSSCRRAEGSSVIGSRVCWFAVFISAICRNSLIREMAVLPLRRLGPSALGDCALHIVPFRTHQGPTS